jgi:hypothetical protein
MVEGKKEITLDEKIINLEESIEQLKAGLHRAIGALEFAKGLKEGKENDENKK